MFADPTDSRVPNRRTEERAAAGGAWGGIPRQAADEALRRRRQSNARPAPRWRLFPLLRCQVPEQIFSWSGGAARLPALSAGNTAVLCRAGSRNPRGSGVWRRLGEGASPGLPPGQCHPPAGQARDSAQRARLLRWASPPLSENPLGSRRKHRPCGPPSFSLKKLQ